MTFEVGQYRAIEMIGAGASAQVWSGLKIDSGAPVALKVFPADQLALARREAALAAVVDHPHVVRVIDVVGDEERCALVTELAAGGDLAELLARRGRLSVGETLTVLLPLAAALATAHERDIVHGDISAQNIVFDLAGRPLLADLGAGRAASEVGLGVTATPEDAAPELARGGRPEPATDMFSLGSLALACLTGRHAWPADDLRDVLIQAAAGQWPDPGDDVGPPALIAAVRALLEHDAERRPGAAEVLMDLRAVGRPVPIDLARRDPAVAAARGRQVDPTGTGFAAVVIDASTPRHGAPETAGPPSTPQAVPTAADRHDPDRVVRARAVTRARMDAVPRSEPSRPSSRLDRLLRRVTRPGAAGTRPPRDSGTGRVRSPGPNRAVRVSLIIVVCVLVTAGATAAGLWWAGLDRSDPVAAAAVVTTRSGPAVLPGTAARTSGLPLDTAPPEVSTPPPAQAPPRAAGVPTTNPVPTSHIPKAPSTTPSASSARPNATTSAGSIRTVDWTATVRALDDARARALTARSVVLLDAVYTSDSAARAADAGVIGRLISGGLRVSGAEHQVAATRVLGSSPIRVEVRDALPSYAILDSTGQVVGRTAARTVATRVLVMVATPAGYRISVVEST